jgi:hypothetical protein|tara:strand:- start:144 stop:314 length:171 start_codon:yes stop_codon:yes gene_type:complete
MEILHEKPLYKALVLIFVVINVTFFVGFKQDATLAQSHIHFYKKLGKVPDAGNTSL